ncbi:NAD(P)H-binding protein [Sphingomonas aerolata]|uniref:NAD(P)H-binding protein n=1 Tax=Sphingomonas aerolata TaxID=185951 RepID=UPI002FE3B1A0
MRVFLTGATGFIGSHVIPELLHRGHNMLGLARSGAGAQQLEAAGADVHRGDLERPETLASGVAAADAVIHCAFDHDFANFVENTRKDERNIAAMGDALAGTNKPILITSGIGIGTPRNGGPATEDVLNPLHANPRIVTELAAAALIARRIDVRTIRLPQVHNTTKAGLITPLIAEARRAGAVAYLGEEDALGCRAYQRCRQAIRAGSRARRAGRAIPCVGRGGRRCTHDRRGHRRGNRIAGTFDRNRRHRALLRLDDSSSPLST